MAVSIEINSKSLQDLGKSLDKLSNGVKDDIMKRTAQAAQNIRTDAIQRIKTQSPNAYNSLSKAMRFSVRKDRPSAAVWNTLHWAPYIENGTVAHIIKAVKAGALYFFSPMLGMAVMVPKKGGFKSRVSKDKSGSKMLVSGKGYVNHPGTEAKPFMMPAARKEERSYIRDIDKILEKRIKR